MPQRCAIALLWCEKRRGGDRLRLQARRREANKQALVLLFGPLLGGRHGICLTKAVKVIGIRQMLDKFFVTDIGFGVILPLLYQTPVT
jgi:hypothetical protein